MKNTFAKKFTVCALAGVLGFALSACDDSSSAGGDETETSALSSAKGQEDVSSSSEKSSSSSSVKDTEPAEVSSSSTKEIKNSSDSKSSSSVKSGDSSSSTETPKSYAEANIMPSGTYDCSKYNCFSTEYLNQEFLEAGKYGEILDERDNQVYKTVTIGSQTWMAENLNFDSKVVGYADGSLCYANKRDSCAKYGRLYTWGAAMDSVAIWGCGYGATCEADTGVVQGICPNGWHLPDTLEWSELFAAVAENLDTAGTALKSETGWLDSNAPGSNSSGFSALPSGVLVPIRGAIATFSDGGEIAYFWSSTPYDQINARDVSLYFRVTNARYGRVIMNRAIAVRCIKDSE